MSRSLVAPCVRMLLFSMALAWPTPASAQLFESGESGARELLAPAEEIALARSAAPAAVSESAAIYVLTPGGLRHGGRIVVRPIDPT